MRGVLLSIIKQVHALSCLISVILFFFNRTAFLLRLSVAFYRGLLRLTSHVLNDILATLKIVTFLSISRMKILSSNDVESLSSQDPPHDFRRIRDSLSPVDPSAANKPQPTPGAVQNIDGEISLKRTYRFIS